MKRYRIDMIKIDYGQLIVNAESIEEAHAIAKDLVPADFEVIQGSDVWKEVKEIEEIEVTIG